MSAMMPTHFPRSYVVWDTETTGLDPRTDKIIEIAAVVVKDGQVTQRWSALINHRIEIPKEATAIHGITREMCELEGVPPAQAFASWYEMIRSVPAHVTHNGSRFDIAFVQYAQAVPAGERFAEFHIDTAALYKARKLQGMTRGFLERAGDFQDRVLDARVYGLKYNVAECCKVLEIPTEGVQAHRALADAMLTNEIYKKLTGV